MFSVIKRRLVFAAAASLLLILVTAFEWSIIGRVSGFIYHPLAGLVWLVFLASGINSLTCLLHIRKIGVRSLVPLMVVAVTFLIIRLVPFTDLWLAVDYRLYRVTREEIVQKVLGGQLKSNVSYNPKLIALGNNYPMVSMGGNEIVVEKHGAGEYVFFYTYRGILDNYAGFLYVPPGGRPSEFSDFNETDSTYIDPLEGRWYWVSHR